MKQFSRIFAAIFILATLILGAPQLVEAQTQQMDQLSIHFICKGKESARLPFVVISTNGDTAAHGMTPMNVKVPRGEYWVHLSSGNEKMVRRVNTAWNKLVVFKTDRASIVVLQTPFYQPAIKHAQIWINGYVHEFSPVEVPKIKRNGSHFYHTLFLTGEFGDSASVDIAAPMGYSNAHLKVAIGKDYWLDLQKEYCELEVANPMRAKVTTPYGSGNGDILRLRVPTYYTFGVHAELKGYDDYAEDLHIGFDDALTINLKPQRHELVIVPKNWLAARDDYKVTVTAKDGLIPMEANGRSVFSVETGFFTITVTDGDGDRKTAEVYVDENTQKSITFRNINGKKAAEVTAAAVTGFAAGYYGTKLVMDHPKESAIVAGGAAVLTGTYLGAKAIFDGRTVKVHSPITFPKKVDGEKKPTDCPDGNCPVEIKPNTDDDSLQQ